MVWFSLDLDFNSILLLRLGTKLLQSIKGAHNNTLLKIHPTNHGFSFYDSRRKCDWTNIENFTLSLGDQSVVGPPARSRHRQKREEGGPERRAVAARSLFRVEVMKKLNISEYIG